MALSRPASCSLIDVLGRISKVGDPDVRRALYDAASALLTRFKRKDKVKSWGQALAKRFCHRKATVAVTRKLAVIMHAMWVAALSFKVGVDDPLRFARSRTVGAHFGLTPKRHQSGTLIAFEGRITKQGDVAIREALCEAAASLLLRVRTWSTLRAWGLRIAKRSSMLCAIVAVARRLAGILHRMWVSETDFKVRFGAKVTRRLRLKPAQ